MLSLMTGCSHLSQSPHIMCQKVSTNHRPAGVIWANQKTRAKMIDMETVIKDRRPIIKAILNNFFSQLVLFLPPKNNMDVNPAPSSLDPV